MSSLKNNTIYKKTSFLAGNNSEFINEFYADYISDPNSLPESWRKFFDGLSDDEKLVYENLRGPSWSPVKKINKQKVKLNDSLQSEKTSQDLKILSHQEIMKKKLLIKNKKKLKDKKLKQLKEKKKKSKISTNIVKNNNETYTKSIKNINNQNNDIVDICLIISNCSIDEISKYLINEGKNKKFPDITIRN